jgi:hypothetical protein
MFRARDAIRALPAVQPGVKPLEWRECNVSDEATDRAESMGQEYSVGYDDNWGWYAYSETLGMDLGNAPTRDAAKVAAQAHYEARILSALEPAVQPDLTDPNVVHANMLRGTIAKPTVDQIRHIYGDDLPNAAAIREAAWNIAVEMELHAAMSTKTEAKAGAIEATILALIDNPGKEVQSD